MKNISARKTVTSLVGSLLINFFSLTISFMKMSTILVTL